MTQLQEKLGSNERFYNCLFAMINNTKSIVNHFEDAKQKFDIDQVTIQKVEGFWRLTA